MTEYEKIDKIRNKITEPTLSIARIPPKTLRRFLDMCSYDEFCDDRGMLLKYLIDFHDGIIPKGTEELELQIDVLEQKINELSVRINNSGGDDQKKKSRLG